ncbi:MAG: hypothetical protein ACLSCV_07770 [Acutalibacteraceae bacterium]
MACQRDIGFIIVATCSADHIMPSVACMLQKQLEFKRTSDGI